MAAAVITVTSVNTGTRRQTWGSAKVRYVDFTSDTGDYAAGGFSQTAASLGLKHIDSFEPLSMATQGTAGASALGVGVTYATSGTSVTWQLYESAGSGSPPVEKGNEAMVANFTFRARVTGW